MVLYVALSPRHPDLFNVFQRITLKSWERDFDIVFIHDSSGLA